jgi:hypothetical protein
MNKQELAEQILKAKMAEYLSEEEIEDTLQRFEEWKTYDFAQAVLAAIVEAMDAPAKEGMRWVKASERLPESGKWVHIKRDSDGYPLIGRHTTGNDYIMDTYETKFGLDEVLWLDESAPAKEAISVPAQQPSLEEKKEDLVASSINTDVSSVATLACTNSNSTEQIKNTDMKNLKVIKVDDESIEFDNGAVLSSYHNQDCCESHYLWFKDLTIEDFKGLEFDLTGDDFFKRIEGYGIELIPIHGHSVKVPGYGSNNGYYSSDLELIINANGKTIKEYDISDCQEISN